MNECDADRVLQIREAVRAQAHCELPAVEKLGDALERWFWTPVGGILPIYLVALFILGRWSAVLWDKMRRWGSGKGSRKSS